MAAKSKQTKKRAKKSHVKKAAAGHPRKRAPWICVIMGSKSDYKTLKLAVDVLAQFGAPYESLVVSAHRSPDWMFRFAEEAEARGVEVIIAGAGGAAHLPGMVAAKTVIPVLGVPVAATALKGLDSLLSIVQMPKGVPVGTLAIGEAGAANAALLALQICANQRPELRAKIKKWRAGRTKEVMKARLPK